MFCMRVQLRVCYLPTDLYSYTCSSVDTQCVHVCITTTLFHVWVGAPASMYMYVHVRDSISYVQLVHAFVDVKQRKVVSFTRSSMFHV